MEYRIVTRTDKGSLVHKAIDTWALYTVTMIKTDWLTEAQSILGYKGY